ncbi:hypothetical protein T492DRAFT_1065357 [Pavlovales sp. CCMP2436]|nr:hypothetical protein T492DRAFT_1065357 [Pavlovales sp. CCMP2436]
MVVVEDILAAQHGSTAINPNPHAPALTPKDVSVCAPAPTPCLGHASAVAALPWRPQGAASSS